MWREEVNLMRRYYENDKKYITRVFRNNDIKCEMNIVGAYSNKESTFMVFLYPLNEPKGVIKNFGPTVIKLVINDDEIVDGFVKFVKKNINEYPPNFSKIYQSEFSKYILNESDF